MAGKPQKEQANIDRRILAKIRGCDGGSGYLEGALCTRLCDERGTCRIKRIKFLIQARNNKAEFDKNMVLAGIPVSVYTLQQTQPDEYIDERVGNVD
jgi:hypothetical protein